MLHQGGAAFHHVFWHNHFSGACTDPPLIRETVSDERIFMEVAIFFLKSFYKTKQLSLSPMLCMCVCAHAYTLWLILYSIYQLLQGSQ